MNVRGTERGAVIIFLAIVSLVLVMFASLAIDVGWSVYVKNQAQGAVDAAALAAAAAIPNYNVGGDRTKVDQLVTSYNGMGSVSRTNSVMSSDPDIQPLNLKFVHFDDGLVTAAASAADANAVRITKGYTAPLFLSKVFGRITQDLSVSAVAMVGPPRCTTPTLPIALSVCDGLPKYCDQTKCGVSYTIAFASNANEDNMAVFDYPGQPTDANRCKNMTNGSLPMGPLCANEQIGLNNGEVNGCKHDMEDKCELLECSPEKPWKVIVPIIGCIGQFVQDTPFYGFAMIGVTDMDTHGSYKSITFKVICDETFPGVPGGTTECGAVTGPILVK